MLSWIQANNTETRITELGGMLESSAPITLQMGKLRPREKKGLDQGHMVVQWQGPTCLHLVSQPLGQNSFNGNGKDKLMVLT